MIDLINQLQIKNFKSIKDLEISPQRINLFIGEPGTGKSNILEALGLLSCAGQEDYWNLFNYLRMEQPADIFYNHQLGQPISISVQHPVPFELLVLYDINDVFKIVESKDNKFNELAILKKSGKIQGDTLKAGGLNFIRFYRYTSQKDFQNTKGGYLTPPNGDNLSAITMYNKIIENTLSSILRTYGLRLSIRHHENKIEAINEIDDVLHSYPFITFSDTMKRIIFHRVAIESNENASIIFEEPETHAFPIHTKHLGERIAMDEKNQYFIATHNPYLFSAIVEKTKTEDLAVFLTYMKNHETHVQLLSHNDISEMMNFEIDPFFNLDRYLPSYGEGDA